MSVYSPALLADFYKISHREQYPQGTEYVYSTWIPRASRMDDIKKVIAFGFQAFVQKWLVDYFDDFFFAYDVDNVCEDYEFIIEHTLGVKNPDSSHIRALHDLGYLPLEIKAIAEGTRVPLRVPMLTIENTKPEFFWLVNYIETLFSCEVWQPSTSATIAHRYREILDHWCEITGDDPEFVPFQGHDFSMRGMEGVEAAAASGAGHLLSFVGTDTIPAILYAEHFYDADLTSELVGTSIPATEHSVMCAGGKDNEYETYRRLIEDVYPNGFLSIVSDTWDLWHVITDTLAKLKSSVMQREGKIVVRPDSGDPVDIICGDPNAPKDSPAYKGVIELLWDIFGGTTTSKGYKVLDPHVGCIYGDAITLSRVTAICERLAKKGFASTNMVYGIGSFTYQLQTRDTFSFALKSTWVQINGQEHMIFKDPATDNGTKKSLTGRVTVCNGAHGGGLVAIDNQTKAQQASRGYDELKTIFKNGKTKNLQTFAQIRKNLERSK